jgi:[FeFe] hydrogenase H-cluster maturation GTPase HydF
MQDTPCGLRLHLGIFGRRNTGKSSLLNALTGQDAAIVSPVPGTTTDVVTKPMELKPLGPVLFLDTAGLDDVGELGQQRIARSLSALQRTDLAFIVTDGAWGDYERTLSTELRRLGIPGIAVFNKVDLAQPAQSALAESRAAAAEVVCLSALTGAGLDNLRQAVVRQAPKEYLEQPPLLSDLINPGDLVVLVVPIDLEAPKGRLILPQVQVIREILDCDAKALVVKERELAETLGQIPRPRLVVTDSQVILKVAGDVPPEVPLTGFSVLMARWKGDLETFVRGAAALDTLKSGDRILILEACTHHPIGDDIGRVKIPRWVGQYLGRDVHFDHACGHDFPGALQAYQLIVHCGACMTNRREVLTRILAAREAGVPITNYGLLIAKTQGVLPRILSPFPQMLEMLKK